MELNADGPLGYIVNVDISYTKEAKENTRHQDLPLAIERRVVVDEMLSDFQKGRKRTLRLKSNKTPKLLATFLPKQGYLCSLPNLQFYLSHGMRLDKVNSVIQFTQSNWLGEYVDIFTQLRKNARGEFAKNLFKLAVNSVQTCVRQKNSQQEN